MARCLRCDVPLDLNNSNVSTTPSNTKSPDHNTPVSSQSLASHALMGSNTIAIEQENLPPLSVSKSPHVAPHSGTHVELIDKLIDRSLVAGEILRLRVRSHDELASLHDAQ